MKIFNETKTMEITNPDLTNGYLKDDRLLIKTIPAIEPVEEKWHYEPQPLDASGGREYKKIIDVQGVDGKEAEEIYEDIQVYIPYTTEQMNHFKTSALKAELEKIKEDIEQVSLFGMIRSDTTEKQIRAAEIVNSLRVIEGKEPRKTTH